MRRVYLRGHANIRKRLLIHIGGFNLGLLMRHLIGVGTPRGLQGRIVKALSALITLVHTRWRPVTRHWCPSDSFRRLSFSFARFDVTLNSASEMAFSPRAASPLVLKRVSPYQLGRSTRVCLNKNARPIARKTRPTPTNTRWPDRPNAMKANPKTRKGLADRGFIDRSSLRCRCFDQLRTDVSVGSARFNDGTDR